MFKSIKGTLYEYNILFFVVVFIVNMPQVIRIKLLIKLETIIYGCRRKVDSPNFTFDTRIHR